MSVKPTPFVSIWMGLDGKEYRPLATSDESFPVQTEYEVTLEDDGAYFYCAVIQQVRYCNRLRDLVMKCCVLIEKCH